MRLGKMLVFTGLLIAVVVGLSLPALAASPATITVEGQADIWDHLFIFLTNDIVRTVLLIIGIAGVVIEIATVGSFGAFGTIGIIAFVLYFMGSIWAGSLGVGAVILLIGGIVLLLLEAFVIPGFGVAGIAGIIAVLASLVVASPNPGTAIWSVIIALAVATVIIVFTLKNKKTRKFWQKLILDEKTGNDEGYVTNDPSLTQYEGAKGIALTVLRPAGTALIDGSRLDVVTSGEYIDAGATVEVILVEGSRIVVRESKNSDKDAHDNNG